MGREVMHLKLSKVKETNQVWVKVQMQPLLQSRNTDFQNLVLFQRERVHPKIKWVSLLDRLVRVKEVKSKLYLMERNGFKLKTKFLKFQFKQLTIPSTRTRTQPIWTQDQKARDNLSRNQWPKERAQRKAKARPPRKPLRNQNLRAQRRVLQKAQQRAWQSKA